MVKEFDCVTFLSTKQTSITNAVPRLFIKHTNILNFFFPYKIAAIHIRRQVLKLFVILI